MCTVCMLCPSRTVTGDDVPLEKSSQEEGLVAQQASGILNTSGGGTVRREEDEIEEQVEEEQPTSHSAVLTEFQSQTAKHTVDLSVHRKQSNDDSEQQGKVGKEEVAEEERELPSPPPPHEEDRQNQRASNLSNASKSSMRSLSEGNLKEPSQSSLRTDLKTGSTLSMKDNLKDASKSSLKSNLKDASKSSTRSDASKVSGGSHVSRASRKSKEAVHVSTPSVVASVKSGVEQETASGAGSIHGSGEEGRSDVFLGQEPTANDPLAEGGGTQDDEGGSSAQESEKMEETKTEGLEGDKGVDGEEGSTDEQLTKQEEGEVAVSDGLHEGEIPETVEEETLNNTSVQVCKTHLSVHRVLCIHVLLLVSKCELARPSFRIFLHAGIWDRQCHSATSRESTTGSGFWISCVASTASLSPVCVCVCVCVCMCSCVYMTI